MKRKNLFFFTTLVFLIFLSLSSTSTTVQSATSGSVLENFTTTTYKDTYNSNVTGWGTGWIELPSKDPIYQDSLKVSTSANSIFVEGNYAYLSGAYDGFFILDTSDPTDLSLAGYYNDSAEINWIYGSVVENDIAYLANAGDGLLILNVTDKANPTKLGEIDLYHALDVKIQGNYAYIPAYSGGIRVIDITDPTAPVDVSGYVSVTDFSDANGVAISGNYLYVAISHAGLDVYDITTPSTPVFVSNVDLDGYAKKVEIKDTYAYVACDLGGLQIVDISDPSNMSRVIWLDDNTRYFGVDIEGNYVYVAGRYGMDTRMMRIYEISDPTTPVAAGYYSLPNDGYDVYVSGYYAYVVATTAGVYSLQIADSGGHYGELSSSFAIAQSNIMYFAPIGEEIERATLTVSDSIAPDTAITYYLSADGGTNWEEVSPGVEHPFTYLGRYLKWRAQLSTIDESVTPTVYSIAIDYYTQDVNIELLSPADGAYIQDQTPILDWTDMPGAYGYLLQVSDSPTFLTLELNESLIMQGSDYEITTP